MVYGCGKHANTPQSDNSYIHWKQLFTEAEHAISSDVLVCACSDWCPFCVMHDWIVTIVSHKTMLFTYPGVYLPNLNIYLFIDMRSDNSMIIDRKP